jgi:hypothetical protein
MFLRGKGKIVIGAAVVAAVLSACGASPERETPPAPNLAPGGNITSSSSTKTTSSAEATSADATEETREADHPTFDNGTAVRETDNSDSGEENIGMCASSTLSGSFGTNIVDGAESASGFISVTNESGVSCYLHTNYPGAVLMGRDGTPINEISYQYDIPPAPSSITLAPGETATAETRWWLTEPCGYMVWTVNLTVLPEDTPMELEPKQSGQTRNFMVCGNSFHIGGFQKV